MSSFLRVIDVVFVLAAVYLVKLASDRRRPAPYPPGPRKLPIVGNLLDMPKEQPWLKFAKWGEKWGPILSVSVFGQRMIIINSSKTAIDMLDKRGAKYSDRPSVPMCDLIGWQNTLVLLQYNERFKIFRKLFHRAIGSSAAINEFSKVEEAETHKFLQRLYANQDDLAAQIRKTAGSVILRISHGYRVQEKDDPIVALADVATDQFSTAVAPEAFLVNLIPPLRRLPDWFPGAGFKKTARSWAKTLTEFVDIPHNFVKDQMARGIAEPSIVSKLLESKDITDEEESDIKWSAGSLYGAGADTTVGTIHAFFKAMALFPEVQKNAQAEIDAVIGTERLPSLEDRDRLPYLNALALEMMRWHNVAPTGIPHRVMEDDIYEGYYIPKGSLVITNIWKMAHDPTVYHNPTSFEPERFLRLDGQEPEPDPRAFCFGFGRRICPGNTGHIIPPTPNIDTNYHPSGRLLADTSIFLTCAMTLAAFTTSKYTDKNEEVLEPDTEQLTGTISYPSPFKVSIKPRSPAALALINSPTENI
ncbi:hypothetical protein AX16_003819 [Volvariella volvacea WC 439]|nr:hypothetical protein AX16_003819 [Volvariella volvacea WC 439]